MELIPGLPDDLARECLFRVPYEQFSTVASICKGWKTEVESPDFSSQRKSTGNSQVLVVVAQARPNPTAMFSSRKHYLPPVYHPVVFEPISGRWSDLPPPPAPHDVLPFFCRFAAVGSNLVVMGGFEPDSWEVLNSVYIYSFLSGSWRRGADMPGPLRSFFCCASDGTRVYVAGGHDISKNALRSAMAYDVEGDSWVMIPDMATERDECRAIFRDRKFHVISGFPTERQGKFGRTAEVFDPATWQWGPVVENMLDADRYPAACVDGAGDEYMYMWRSGSGNILALRGTTWQAAAELPADLASPTHMMRWHGKLMVFGSDSDGKRHLAYTLDLQSKAWTKVEAPGMFSSQVMEGCCLEI